MGRNSKMERILPRQISTWPYCPTGFARHASSFRWRKDSALICSVLKVSLRPANLSRHPPLAASKATRIANARRDFPHKTSTTISKNHAVEDLQVRNMSQSAAGTLERPGKDVAAKRGLNRAILDQGWGEFRRQLAYTLGWAGGVVVAVPLHHTSQFRPARTCRRTTGVRRPVSLAWDVGTKTTRISSERSMYSGQDKPEEPAQRAVR